MVTANTKKGKNLENFTLNFIRFLRHHNTFKYFNILISLQFLFYFNLFLVNAPFSYPLKTSENQKFSGIFKEHKMGQ